MNTTKLPPPITIGLWKDLPDGTWVEIRDIGERDEHGIGYVVCDWKDGDYCDWWCVNWRDFRRKDKALKYYRNFEKTRQTTGWARQASMPHLSQGSSL